MKKYLLDSDTLSYLEQPESPFYTPVNRRLCELDDTDEVSIPILALYEIHHGISWGSEEDRPYFLRIVSTIEEKFPTAGLSPEGARIYGDLKAAYRKESGASGKHIKRDDIDLMIASIAIEHRATLVSHDKLFKRLKSLYPSLEVEDWAV